LTGENRIASRIRKVDISREILRPAKTSSIEAPSLPWFAERSKEKKKLTIKTP